jgi:DNA-binding transcriptional ArsR family regulator
VPDFLLADDTAYLRSFSDELDGILASTDEQIREELDLCYGHTAPRVVQRLRDEGGRALRQLANAASALYQECLAPDWRDLRRTLDAEVQRHTHLVVERGPAAMLDGLHPGLSWHASGTLTVAKPGPPVRHQLARQGLQIHPNLFLDQCAVLRQPGRPTALLHPAAPRTRTARPTHDTDGLVLLIGPARSRALRAIGQGPCSTTELAATLGIAPGSSSAHTNALRAAGLISTTRRGRQVHHALTALGRELLRANPS